MTKKRILFISESVTLAHFARPFELSNQLPAGQYDIHFACAPIYQRFLADTAHTLHTIYSIPAEQFKQALSKGDPLYNFSTLKGYVEEDLALIAKVKPDLIVGDFRISLAVSARLAKIPYITISNAYWSPFAPQSYPVPCLPLTKYLGVKLGGAIFRLAAPIAFKVHALAMLRLKRHFGLPTAGLDLRQVYTEADYTMYADVPSMFPLHNPPSNHFFVGPVLWSPTVPEPDWWHQLPVDRPVVYVSMGSSGSKVVLEKIVSAFINKEVSVIVSKSGAEVQLPAVSNIFTADYIDGLAAAKRADVVICNGGSLTCQQAFIYGKPVLGIADNMDQYLNMEGVLRVGAGVLLRADELTESKITEAYRAISNNQAMDKELTNIQKEIAVSLQAQTFVNYVAGLF
jgi:UDP:flavonoid glycosyltransferase YjiC (YdhE family)